VGLGDDEWDNQADVVILPPEAAGSIWRSTPIYRNAEI